MTLSQVVICNMALGHLGITKVLASTDGTIALATPVEDDQKQCAIWFDTLRQSLLRAFPYRFARKYVALTIADDGDGEVFDDAFLTAYTYPADCIQGRNFVQPEAGSRQYLPLATIWERRQFGGVSVIMADTEEETPVFEYTAKPATDAGYPIDFDIALSWNLAAVLAGPLKAADAAKADRAARMAYITTSIAQRTDASERNARIEPDGDFLRSRGDGSWLLPFNGGLLT